MIKGGAIVEELLDKTGTLTEGEPEVVDVLLSASLPPCR
jgi:cation transport ATPase